MGTSPSFRIALLVALLGLALLVLETRIRRVRFTPPTPEQRRAAIGDTAGLTEPLRRALDPAGFEPIPRPGPHDWLANHPEPEQTFAQFRDGRPNRPDARRNRLYLLPLGEFAAGESPPLETLREFAAAFFGLETRLLPAARLETEAIPSRVNRHTRKRQFLAPRIFPLLQRRLPANAYALLGITMADLYPDPTWNFVFGQASLQDRVGVYSFARMNPRFFGETRAKDWRQQLLLRSCKLLAHETGHMFGILHCTFFHCLMNGSNHLDETDRGPIHLCPVDLRKLQHSGGFDVTARYRRLRDVCHRAGFTDEVRWLDAALARIGAGPGPERSGRVQAS